MTDRDFVTTCLREIFQRNGYEDPDKITQRDFEHISAEIAAKTTILISVATLKRLMQGRFARLPQTATLNAISQYLGYNNWQDYKMAVRERVGAKSKVEAVKPGTPSVETIRAYPLRRAIPLALLFAACLLLLIGYSVIRPTDPGYDKASFSFRKTTGNDIPNTVVFSYNIDEVNADSFFIQQSWDRNRRVRVHKNQYTLTDTYYEPGYHTAKLIANDSIIMTAGVSIPTDGWFFYSKRNFFDSIPQYITTRGMPGDGTLSLTPSELSAANTIERYYYYLYISSEARGDADNFRFRARVKVEPLGTAPCPFVVPEVFTENGGMYVKATLKGCTGESLAQFGENFQDGRVTDLSSLGTDVRNWMDIEMVCEERVATVYYDGEAVFTLSYNRPAGKLAGLGFISNGLCKVDFVELSSSNGLVFYSDDFELPN